MIGPEPAALPLTEGVEHLVQHSSGGTVLLAEAAAAPARAGLAALRLRAGGEL